MDEQELIKKCLINKDSIVTYPFANYSSFNHPVLRHKSNNKWFGLIFYLNKTLYINLKAEPETVWILKQQYPNIISSAWHMNKTHWYKVEVNKITPELLDTIIHKSFDITSKKSSRK